MNNDQIHSFHIPVMGTSFTIDSPLKVAKFGIDSVMQIGDDELCEAIREHYSKEYNLPFTPIARNEEKRRPRRFTAYLNMVNKIIDLQISDMRKMSFEENNDLNTYFKLMPDDNPIKQIYTQMKIVTQQRQKNELQEQLRKFLKPGSIDVNIMTKVDKDYYDKEGNKLPEGTSDALTALRGYAESDLKSSIVFSAGFNPRVYSYVSKFEDFYPDKNGDLKKRIVLKVSDFRSAQIQGKFLAKKGLWVSEYRVESGLNCGGHAFASSGHLMGPILEEFKVKKEALFTELYSLCQKGLEKLDKVFTKEPQIDLTVQGGIGNNKEHNFLKRFFNVSSIGWATPFLLVPEACTVDDGNLEILKNAKREDLYLSNVSPIGVPFNTVHGTESEKQRDLRIAEGKPGSPCYKKHLELFNKEFSKLPLCLAARAYQKKKIEQLKSLDLSKEAFKKAYDNVVAKVCLCEDLAAGALVKYGITNKRALKPAICPGPNIAYFSKVYSLKEMVDHIYGKINLLQDIARPHMFLQELKMYIDYLKKETTDLLPEISPKNINYLNQFKNNLVYGIEYYKTLATKMAEETKNFQKKFQKELIILQEELDAFFGEFDEVFALSA